MNNTFAAGPGHKCQENQEYLQSQLVTYIGNKRALLDFIGQGVGLVQQALGKEKLSCFDGFAGSGVVGRYLKQYSSYLAVNDLELYSQIINRCYLSNKSDLNISLLQKYYEEVCQTVNSQVQKLQEDEAQKAPGFITQFYSPANEKAIQKSDRCFYTKYNANYIDLCRQNIEKLVPSEYRDFFIAPLLSEASIHANTAGIFKGFYKNRDTGLGQFGGKAQNALSRILGKIALPFPVFSDFNCQSKIFSSDTNELVKSEELYESGLLGDEHTFDLAYFDPPYNQHPYGSNYFMLNLIASYNSPDPENISRVSGIPRNWNRSLYNKKKQVMPVFQELIKNVRAKFVLISFNSEGFIQKDEMIQMLSECGQVQVLESDYNTFRGSRNLKAREIHVKEYLFLLDKRSKI
ncbi:MAG: DNA adenine methylase [Treponema sp.]|nr:DNA adenine methylase [Treponema sp.]